MDKLRRVLAAMWLAFDEALKEVGVLLAPPPPPPKPQEIPEEKTRDWMIEFGPANGRAGEVLPVTVDPSLSFRVEKLIGVDDSDEPGMGTMIIGAYVGQRVQSANGMLTKVFANTTIGNGWKWDNCVKGEKITVNVLFLVDCQWTLTAFGKAVL